VVAKAIRVEGEVGTDARHMCVFTLLKMEHGARLASGRRVRVTPVFITRGRFVVGGAHTRYEDAVNNFTASLAPLLIHDDEAASICGSDCSLARPLCRRLTADRDCDRDREHMLCTRTL
jgi:hypothetical protein